MYAFYEIIKKEVDLQDLVDYLNSPLEKLKLLQIKLQEYKEQHITENKIEIEELIRETDKLEKTVFPDLINNYCKLSLEFRNNTIIKESKNKEGNVIGYTSKDLLLKNIAKLIEHIHLLDEKFYKYFSFEFLVNSRIISDLGYQENYIDNKYEPIVLTNQYVFKKEDAKQIIDKQLGKYNQPVNDVNRVNTEKHVIEEESKSLPEKTLEFIKPPELVVLSPANIATLLQPKLEESKEPEVIFEKKPQPNIEKTETNNSNATSSGSISLFEILLALGMITFLGIGATTVYHKVNDSSKDYEAKIRNERLINQIQEQNKEEKKEEIKNTEQVLKELAKNKEKHNFVYDSNSEQTYKKTAILMTQIINWKQLAEKSPFNEDKISFTVINGFQNQKGQMLMSPRDMIDNGKSYHIDVIDSKAQLKINNISKNECQYNTFKLGQQYNIEANDKSVNVDNMNSVCETENILKIVEK